MVHQWNFQKAGILVFDDEGRELTYGSFAGENDFVDSLSDYPIWGSIGSTDFLGAAGDIIALNQDNIPGVIVDSVINCLVNNIEER